MVFSSSGDIIKLIKTELGIDENLFSLNKIWENELGVLAQKARIIGIRKGEILVEVDSSVHFSELNIRKAGLIKKINQYFGAIKFLKKIKIKLKE